ncbi:purple acid phosphatase family protein [Corynebacterium sanguinis]|uniref:purple acid phosphatase family protein n=1 Tax=Corynebacterium sanguinis TaxID=2594913 RepID=UPI0010A9E923|nr:metallophosphoesterase family protein [Corynebacterium sanguinis]MCT1413958.1 metallophosphoesterase family protein [Corynebacterium sanguinis]MCT1627747.1 metallophosphoesterase family protein [Corynebacterium sanguinis]
MTRKTLAAAVVALSLTVTPVANAQMSSSSSQSSSAPGSSAPNTGAVSGPIFRAATGIGADEKSVNFSWRSTYTGDEVVRIHPVSNPDAVIEVAGREADYGAIAYLSRFAEVSDLTPGETYSYQIGSDAGGFSAPESFTIDDGDDSWKFVAVSDAQIGVNLKVSEQGATWRTTAGNAAAANPDASLFVSLGDQVEGWGDLIGRYGQYNEFFSAPQLRTYRFAAIEGNHETYPSGASTRHFKEHWNLPNEQGETSNYFFEQNNALFIALNSNRKDDAGLAEQAQFVRDTVAAHGGDKDWVIVLNHFAFHSHGGRYTDDDIVRMRNVLSPVFSEVGVDVVLNGHDHMYNRSYLMNGLEPVVPGAPAEPGDVLHQGPGEVLYLTLSTAGGGKFYDFEGNDGNEYPGMTLAEARERNLNRPTIAYWNQDYTPDYSVVSVEQGSLNILSVNAADGSLVDDVTLTK